MLRQLGKEQRGTVEKGVKENQYGDLLGHLLFNIADIAMENDDFVMSCCDRRLGPGASPSSTRRWAARSHHCVQGKTQIMNHGVTFK